MPPVFTLLVLPSPPEQPCASLLSVRAAVVLLGAFVVSVVAGALGYLAHRDVPTAMLIAGGAVGGTLLLLHALLGR